MQLILSLAVLLFISIKTSLFADEQASPDWSYDNDTGPEQWGNLGPEFAACCDGRAQSPINLCDATLADSEPITFDYHGAPVSLWNNGHTVGGDYRAGGIWHAGKQYLAVQFHFHHPSEHTLDGRCFPMELHIVHQAVDSDRLAVVGVMLAVGETHNTAYDTIFANLPSQANSSGDCTLQIDATDLLPPNPQHFYTYEGSLTTPPCSEIVHWLVLADFVAVTAEQIAAFDVIYHNNARPVQPRGQRDIFTSQ